MILRDTKKCTGMTTTNSGKCLPVGHGEGPQKCHLYGQRLFLKFGGNCMALHYITLYTFLYDKYFTINLPKISIGDLLYICSVGRATPPWVSHIPICLVG